jgi:hypothetical protein
VTTGRRQRAQDVDQLARPHRGVEAGLVAAEFGRGAHLDLQVAGGELGVLAGLAQQHVGQDGQRVPAFDDAGHRLQGTQHSFPVLLSEQSFLPL